MAIVLFFINTIVSIAKSLLRLGKAKLFRRERGYSLVVIKQFVFVAERLQTIQSIVRSYGDKKENEMENENRTTKNKKPQVFACA